MHANILSAHYFYLETCEVWPANIIVFVFLQTSRLAVCPLQWTCFACLAVLCVCVYFT